MTVGISECRCILVIGATAGIGRALALALHDLPSKPNVIVGGRRQERLDELTKTSDRIKGVLVDVTSKRGSKGESEVERVRGATDRPNSVQEARNSNRIDIDRSTETRREVRIEW